MDINVAIVTFQGRFNYGNRLQNYAVDRIYKDFGLIPTSLILNRKEAFLSRIRGAVRALVRPNEDPENLMTDERLASFDRFNEKMSFQEVNSLDSRLVQSFQLFSVGSDQIWYLDKGHKDEDWRFLTFVPPMKRITMSPSMGRNELGPIEGERLSQYLSDFPSISVRESKGAKLIKQYAKRDAVVTCDPTLAIPAETWRMESDSRDTPPGEYVFTYLLGGMSSESSAVLKKVTKNGLVPVVPLSDRETSDESAAGPSEFISLVDNAAHVVTDSFHAAAFSAILQTPLTIVHRVGGSNMFPRLETLASTLGIEHMIFGSPSYDLSRAQDYRGVQKAIGREREKLLAYLVSCLDSQLPGWRDDARA